MMMMMTTTTTEPRVRLYYAHSTSSYNYDDRGLSSYTHTLTGARASVRVLRVTAHTGYTRY